MGEIASHLWQSTVVAVVAAALAWLCRRNRASVRYWIWFAASMKFLLPFAALSALAGALPRFACACSPENEAVAAITAVFRLTGGEPLAYLSVVSSRGWWWIFGVWLAGTFVVAAKWLRDWNHVTAVARNSDPIVSGPVHETVRRIEHALDVRTPIKIVASNDDLEPGILGVRTAVLVWPGHLASGLNSDHLEPIIAHELCHVVRRDNLLASAHMFVSALFWFHPLVWWIGARLIEERERACDEQVLALGQSPAAYAAGILKTCELCISSPLVNVPGVTGGDLKKRIERIMWNRTGSPLGLVKKATLVFVALAICFAPIAAEMSFAMPQRAGQQPARAQNNDPDQPVRPGGNVKPPRLKKEVKPQYTARAIQEKIEGEVLMECVVKADGTVGDIKIVKSLDPDLDQAAVDAAQQWEFEPGTRDGKPVAVLVTIAIAFTLKQKEQ